MARSRTGVAVVAALVGVAAGVALARTRQRAHRHELFDPRAWRRLGALAWLERNGGSTALPLLRDYVAWERQPQLRARATRVLRDLERAA